MRGGEGRGGGDYQDRAKIVEEEEDDAAAWRTGGGAVLRRRIPACKLVPPQRKEAGRG